MSTASSISTAQPESALSDRMVQLIRRAIMRGGLQPGAHLSQTGLAEEYSVSKVPVREALKQLHAEGLLQHDRNRGYFVTRLSRGEARQLYKLRRWLEAELLRSARWPNATEIKKLKAYFEIISRPLSPGKREIWLEALTAARELIFSLSPEKILLREAMRLWTLTDRFRALLPDEESATGEKALYDALVMKDRDTLLAAHSADRDRIEHLLEEVFDSLPGYWTAD
ncbi:putative GntR family transcriptional regulator [Sphingobium sp. SYK-6]|uniref:GntR family transcriptional regulator n=1 Tax=Sphingobium sp. (strain NBRC 103272 / SYK-6) TaxID=627192 RepID=UPI000227744E|nr:GntR family transcriptional regulator [Sphingobium sp. SYK-6]BAK66565.1 putative GntR family transcriptional regulator [Sphingobium sp. SYK-6]